MLAPAFFFLITSTQPPPIVAILIWRWMLDTRVGVINGLLTGLGIVGHPSRFRRVLPGCGQR